MKVVMMIIVKVVGKLKKAISGLKQAGRTWNNKLDSVLTKIDFKRPESEP